MLEGKVEQLEEALADRQQHIDDLRETIRDLRKRLEKAEKRIVDFESVVVAPILRERRQMQEFEEARRNIPDPFRRFEDEERSKKVVDELHSQGVIPKKRMFGE